MSQSNIERVRYKLPVAVFMLLKGDNEILLIQRAKTGWMDGYYSLPAGSLDENEEIQKGAIRECKEEVGVDISENDVKFAHVQHCKVEDKEWVNMLFVTEKWEGDPKVCEPHKHSEVKWCDIDNMPDNMIEYAALFIKDFAKGNFYSQFGWDN